MTDDLDAQLRASLREEELPAAPDSIASFIAQLPTTEALLTQNRGLRSVAVVVVAVALIAAAAFGISGLDRAIGGPDPSASSTPSLGSGDVSPTRTVSEVLAARVAGTLHGETVTIRGFWSARPVMAHTCSTYPGKSLIGLEQVSCHEGEYGITELDELILTAASPQPTQPPSPFQNVGGYWTGPRGPYLTPFIPAGLQDRLLNQQILLRQEPEPIIVSGHFDDSQVAECDAQARQDCEDRFVIVTIISFDPPPVPSLAP